MQIQSVPTVPLKIISFYSVYNIQICRYKMCLNLCVIIYTFLTFIRGDNVRLVLAWAALVDGHGGPVLE